ncbi:MAG: TonB-dependent receptor [Cyclobacteriaceae bacterium]|nr:TonB-dependent receptor [Cyclobacteriaceae bacterium]
MLPLYSDVSYNFYDINGKFNHRIKDTGKIFLSFYLNGDRASATDEFRDRSYVNNTKLNLNNRSLTLGYNTKLSPKLFVENYLIHSSYSRYVNEETISSKDLGRESNISTGFSVQDNIWKTRFGLTTNRHKIKFGADAHWKEFIPTQFISVQGNDLVPLDTIRNITEVQQAIEISPYVEDELRITKGLNINLGLRFPFYLTKTAKYNFLEPRASLRWLMTESFSLKAGYARMYQFTHALINNFNSMEHEIWLSAHENLPPQSTDIISLGVFTQWKKKLDIGLEGYYKKMASLIEYKPSVEEMYQTDQFENFLEKGGTGEAYGMELFAQGPLGPGFASLSYTLSWNFRQFENINFGRPYPFLFDRRHVLDITAQYPLNEKWGLSTAWTFNSGRATNLPVAYIKTNEYYLGYYAFEGKNQQNLPPYHRLDISAKRESKTKKRGRYQYISFNLYNAYLRKNPVMVYFMPQDEKAHKVTSFFVVPSVSYGLTF